MSGQSRMWLVDPPSYSGGESRPTGLTVNQAVDALTRSKTAALTITSGTWCAELIVADGAGAELPRGQEGRLLVRGASLGYHGRPDLFASAATTANGSTPATWPAWTTTATSGSVDGRRTGSFAAGRTCPPSKSSTSCCGTPGFVMSLWSGCPIRVWANVLLRWSFRPTPPWRQRSTTCARIWAQRGWPRNSGPSTCTSSMPCRARRVAKSRSSCCVPVSSGLSHLVRRGRQSLRPIHPISHYIPSHREPRRRRDVVGSAA